MADNQPEGIDSIEAGMEKRFGLPSGLMRSVRMQETGGNQKYITAPDTYHYGLNAEGRRVAGHTGQISTAFGPYGILESTGAKPGYGVAPLNDKSLAEQARFGAEYLAGRIKAAGGVAAGLAGYGEGAKYAAQVIKRMGGAVAQPDAVPAVAPPSDPQPRAARPEGWPTLPTLRKNRAAEQAVKGPDTSTLPLIAGASQAAQAGLDSSAPRAETERATAEAEKLQAERDATGFTDVFQEGRRDPRLNPTFTAIDYFNRDVEVPPEGWTYAANQDIIEEGYSDEERAYLRENVTGPKSLAAAQGQIEYRRGLDKTYGLAGGFASFTGMMAAGMLDPGSFALGMGAGKALGMAGIGSRVLANAGRPGAAAASFVGENVAVNLGLDGMQDYMGEVKTSADYAMSAASGVLLAAPFIRGASAPDVGVKLRADLDAINTKVVEEQVLKADQVVRDTNLTDPVAVAREVEKRDTAEIAEMIQVDQQEHTLRNRMVPEDLAAEHRAELDGVVKDTPEPLEAAAMVGMARERSVPQVSTRDGSAFMRWTAKVQQGQHTVNELLQGLAGATMLSPELKKVVQFFSKNAENLGRVGVNVADANVRANFDPGTQQINLGARLASGTDPLAKRINNMTPHELYSSVHEVGHALTHSKIDAYLGAGRGAGADVHKAVGALDDVMRQVAAHIERTGEGRGAYGMSNLHEFAAEVWSNKAFQDFLKGVKVGPTSLWGKVVDAVAKLFGLGKDKDALAEAQRILESVVAADGSHIRDAVGQPLAYAQPAPQQATAFARQYAEKMHGHAKAYMARNPIQTEKLKTLTAKVGGLSSGLILASSKNPMLQMAASIMVPTTTGAAGRRSTVVSRRHALHGKLVGQHQVEYDAALSSWAKANNISAIELAAGSTKEQQFYDAVYTELLNRRDPNYQGTADLSIKRAADADEALYSRTREAQVSASTLGADRLPTSSRGYVPQALDAGKIQALSPEDLELLHVKLSEQFQARDGFDQAFSDSLAVHYVDRVRRRGQGQQQVDVAAAGGEGGETVRQALEDMANNPELRDRAMAAMSSLGQGHTKKRLDLDLREEIRPGLKLMDVYNTNTQQLARIQAARVAGTVALTERGIYGMQGLQAYRNAAGTHVAGSEMPTARELDAFDQIASEIMGIGYSGRVASTAATNLGLIVNLQKMGGLVFTQFADTFSMLHTLGLNSLLSGVPSLGRHLAEGRKVHHGQASGNQITQTVEMFSTDIGMEQFKMVAHLDPPSGMVSEYVEQAGMFSRLLRAGSHLQAKITGFRALMMAQHRMVAEQVTLKAMRFIREGGEDKALADMGFTPELRDAIRAELPNITTWGSDGRLTSLDLTRVSDVKAAEAFSEAVHYGVSQIIQGTYIGERGKWAHNDYLRMLLQLRTFGLTAMEKQWSRVGHNQGYHYAAMAMMGQMALALPIHIARVQMASAGREDQDKYLKDNLNPVALARATMNYSSMSGLTGDVMDTLIGVAGGWGGAEAKEMLGARNQSTGVGRLIPGAGVVDQGLRTLSGNGDLYSTLKQMPFSNVWYLVPLLNIAKKE